MIVVNGERVRELLARLDDDDDDDDLKHSLGGTVANKLYCDVVVAEYKLHLCYFIHFQTNTLGKVTKPFIIYLVSRVFENGPRDKGSIPGRVITKI